MNPIISIMAQGGMGAATASRLVQKGLEVRTDLTGRSAVSAKRAAKAGMNPSEKTSWPEWTSFCR